MEPRIEQPKSVREIQGSDSSSKKTKHLNIEGYSVGGLSIGGHETCIIFPYFNVAFDIGRCPPHAVSQDFLFISHAHMDHIGGLPMYVATRGLYRMKPPTIVVPKCIKDDVEKLFEVHRKMDHSELKHNLIGLDVGEEFYLRRDLKIKPFKTYHVIPSQGYLLYLIKQKLKQEFTGLSRDKIKNLKLSGVEITYTLAEPEIAFTGDTTSDFIIDKNNVDVLRARILVTECTFINNSITVEHARDYGHTHLSEVFFICCCYTVYTTCRLLQSMAHERSYNFVIYLCKSIHYRANQFSLDSKSCREVEKPSDSFDSLFSPLHSRGNSGSSICIAVSFIWSNFCTYGRFLAGMVENFTESSNTEYLIRCRLKEALWCKLSI